MHYSFLLLAFSIALHEHFAQDTSAAAETVNAPTRAHTFLELKNGTRPQSYLSYRYGKTEDDERMLPSNAGETSMQKIRSLFSANTAESVVEKIREAARANSGMDQVESIFANMKTEELKQAVETFTSQNKFLADQLIAEWKIEPVATALVKAKHSDNEQIRKNGKILLDDLLRSLEDTMHWEYPNIFIRMELDAEAVERVGFADARVELMYDLIKYIMVRNPNDEKMFKALRKGFKDSAIVALIIGLAKAEDKSAETLETRFVRYFVESEIYPRSFMILLTRYENEYSMFKLHQFEMMEKFLVLKRVRKKEIPHQVLEMLIKEFPEKGSLAIKLSKMVGNLKNRAVAKKYEKLYFQYLKSEGHIGPDKIKYIFSEKQLATEPATLFVERYKQWFPNNP